MDKPLEKTDKELHSKLKLLMLSRVVFTSFLLGSTIIFQLGTSDSLLVLYGLIGGIFLLSCIYILLLGFVLDSLLFTFIQVAVDTGIVSLILFVTGGYASVFSFLYLVVIIYSSILLPRWGVLVIAALCSIQYGVMIDLEYFEIIKPLALEGSFSAVHFLGKSVLFKVLVTIIACFAVALLSGFLAEQTVKTKQKLQKLEDHVTRVEKMAYMGEMAAGMAHEIKNPLAALAGSIQLLREDIHYDPYHDKLMQIALRETDRLSELVGNFLLFARPQAGKIEKIDLRTSILEVLELFEKNSECASRIDIAIKLAHSIWIKIDPVHFRQVLWNILLNAAEAIEKEGNIDIRLYGSKNNQATLEIEDNGCGIPETTQKMVFDPFYTTKAGGTGLGLSIAHSILETYEYSLSVESSVTSGTVFALKVNRTTPPETEG
ncbi:MAG: two-component sensor histidine kinase [Desulfobacterales bacterium]|nr:two-component sensor histidine kinase [Desulfobacterales bacterium]